MRNCIRFTVVGAALMAGTSLASAQTVIANQPVETIITQEPGSMLFAQQPIAAPPPSIVVAQPAGVVGAVLVQTVEPVRTVQSTTTPRHKVANRPTPNVTTTRTSVHERVVPAPMVAAAPVPAIAQPGYTQVIEAPAAAWTYPAPLYDVVPGAVIAPLATPAPEGVLTQPVAGGAIVTPVPTFRYVYEPDRILVIDAISGIAVQAMPR